MVGGTIPGRAVTACGARADIGREICEHPGVAEQPAEPDPERQQHLLGVLGELIAHGGPDPLLAPPVVPGAEAFPEPWEPSVDGASTLLRRLVQHAGMTQGIAVVDERRAALATERKPETHVEVTAIRNDQIAVRLLYIGKDDVAGTCAHEIGVAHAALTRFSGEGPYRAAERREIEVDGERDLERGSIAAVYLGLGVLAANGAYQQYSRQAPGPYAPVEYDVLRAGYVALSDLAYLLAVQAVVRGETAPPHGLQPVQRDEVTAWLDALRDRGAELRGALAIPADARPIAARPAVGPLSPARVAAVAEPAPARRAFRWQGHRGFLGFAVGGVALILLGSLLFGARTGSALLGCFAVGAIVGHLVGRGVKIARCSACATVVGVRAERCRKCDAVFRGDIASLAQRLEAEERLDEAGDPP